MVTFTQSIRAVSRASTAPQNTRTGRLYSTHIYTANCVTALLGQFMSHKALPGIRGQAITTAEQQLAPTTCSILTAVTGGQAGPQKVSAQSNMFFHSLFQTFLKDNS